jgi:hypothetical protein
MSPCSPFPYSLGFDDASESSVLVRWECGRGSRPERSSASRSKYSMWPFTLRNSSSAHLSKAACSFGSRRRGKFFLGAIDLIQRAGIDYRAGRTVRYDRYQQIVDHSGFFLLIELETLCLELTDRHLHHAHSTFDYRLAGGQYS